MSYRSSKRAFDSAFRLAIVQGVEDSFAAALSFGLFELASTLQRERADSAAAIAKLMASLEQLERTWTSALELDLPAGPDRIGLRSEVPQDAEV